MTETALIRFLSFRLDSFARFLVPEIWKYYESEQGQREFEEWEAQQEQEEGNK